MLILIYSAHILSNFFAHMQFSSLLATCNANAGVWRLSSLLFIFLSFYSYSFCLQASAFMFFIDSTELLLSFLSLTKLSLGMLLPTDVMALSAI